MLTSRHDNGGSWRRSLESAVKNRFAVLSFEGGRRTPEAASPPELPKFKKGGRNEEGGKAQLYSLTGGERWGPPRPSAFIPKPRASVSRVIGEFGRARLRCRCQELLLERTLRFSLYNPSRRTRRFKKGSNWRRRKFPAEGRMSNERRHPSPNRLLSIKEGILSWKRISVGRPAIVCTAPKRVNALGGRIFSRILRRKFCSTKMHRESNLTLVVSRQDHSGRPPWMRQRTKREVRAPRCGRAFRRIRASRSFI